MQRLPFYYSWPMRPTRQPPCPYIQRKIQERSLWRIIDINTLLRLHNYLNVKGGSFRSDAWLTGMTSRRRRCHFTPEQHGTNWQLAFVLAILKGRDEKAPCINILWDNIRFSLDHSENRLSTLSRRVAVRKTESQAQQYSHSNRENLQPFQN